MMTTAEATTTTLTAPRDALRDALRAVLPAVRQTSPHPALASVLLRAREGLVSVTGTDHDVTVRHAVAGAETSADLDVLLPPDRLVQILSSATTEHVTLAADGASVTVTAGRNRFVMPTEDAARFPTFDGFTATQYHEVSAENLRRLIRRVAFACCDDGTKYAVFGALWEFTPETLTAAATDGRRMSTQEVPAQAAGGNARPKIRPIVPPRAMKLLRGLLGPCDGPANVGFDRAPNGDARALLVRAGSFEFRAALSAGNFMDFHVVMGGRRSCTAAAHATAGALRKAAEAASVMLTETTRAVRCSFRDGLLEVRTVSADRGSGEVVLDLAYEGEPAEVVLDGLYLREGLRELDDDAPVRLDLAGPFDTVYLGTGDGYCYCLQPIDLDRAEKP